MLYLLSTTQPTLRAGGLRDLRERHRADLGGAFPVGKLKKSSLQENVDSFMSDLPGHHAQYRADSICGDSAFLVRESIKALLENLHLTRV